MDAIELLKRDYEERKLICFADNADDIASRNPPAGVAAGAAVAAAGGLLFLPLAGPVLAAGLAYLLIRGRRGGARGIVVVPRGQAGSFELDPGAPQRKVVYAGHPLRPPRYYPLASFHYAIFQDKVREFTNLAVALGARDVHIKVREGYSTDASAAIAASTDATARLGGRVRQVKNQSMELSLSLDNRVTQPRLPTTQAWYKIDENWQHLAKLRLENRLTTYHLNLEHREDFGIDMKLAAAVQGYGLELGGSFEVLKHTVWGVDLSF